VRHGELASPYPERISRLGDEENEDETCICWIAVMRDDLREEYEK
jgi:hypothetical protein